MKKRVVSRGKHYTDTLPIFRELVLKSGMKEQDNLIFAGCSGACYSMATFFSLGISALDINLYFATDSDIGQAAFGQYSMGEEKRNDHSNHDEKD